MKVILRQLSPNFCFELTAAEAGTFAGKSYLEGDEVCFVQSDYEWADLAGTLGWVPDADKKPVDQYSDAFDWLAENDGEEFEIGDDDAAGREHEPQTV